MEVFSAFHDYPKEAALVGRILAEWGELEFELASLVGTVLKNRDQAVRIIFRVKGEESRINVADAILRPYIERAKLKNQYEAMLGAIRHCKKIRNQYAHAHWVPGHDGLGFSHLEDAASSALGDAFFTVALVDEPLLRLQEQYMNYTSRWLWWLMDEYQHRVDATPTPAAKAPQIIDKPSLCKPA